MLRGPAPGAGANSSCAGCALSRRDHLQEALGLAIGETVILLHSPLPLVGVSIVMMRECQQNDSLADG